MKRILIVLFLMHSLLGWANPIDSLRQKLKTTTSDSVKFELQNQLFQRMISSDIDSSFSCISAQRELLKIANYRPKTKTKFQIDYHVNAGIFFNRKGNSKKSLEHYELAFEQSGKFDFKKEGATVLNNIANIHYQNGDYAIALDYHLKGLTIRKELKDTAGTGMSLGNIGLIYEVQEEYEKAIEKYKEAQSYFLLTKNPQSIAWSYRVIGTAYMEMKQFDLALENLQKSRSICAKIGDLTGEEYCILNLGVVYNDWYVSTSQLNYLDSADYYLDLLKDEHQNLRIEVNYLNYKSRLLLYRKEYKKALDLLVLSGQKLEYSEMKSELKDVYQLKSQAYAGMNDFKAAYEFHVKFKKLSDELFSVEKDQELGRKQAEFVYNEQLKIEQLERENQREVHRIEQQRYYLLIVVIGLSFVLSVITFIYFYRKKVKLNRALKAERDEIIRKFESLELAYSSVLTKLNVMQDNSEQETETAKPLPDWVKQLSKRELEVLSCVSVGMTDKEIQEKLFISVATVRTHCQRIYAKLLVKNRVEAANLVREYGLI